MTHTESIEKIFLEDESIVSRCAEPFSSLEGVQLSPLLERVKSCRLVLLGEATHGTAEFYRMRAEITKALIEQHGFNIVAVEADWPDAAAVDRYVRSKEDSIDDKYFSRFPVWMWRNTQMQYFISWLRQYNRNCPEKSQAGFYGLDLYSLHASIDAVLKYLEKVDPSAAVIARRRYGCFEPWQDPAAYGAAAISGEYKKCEQEVIAILKDLLDKRLNYVTHDGVYFFDAVSNAQLVADAEQYYRIMYYGSSESWNWRDRHMFRTLEALLNFSGPKSKAVVWEHNSHVGDMSATQMSQRREINVGQLCRERFGAKVYLVGFGTDHGTVAAASDWDGPMEIKDVQPAHPDSYEGLFHRLGEKMFLLPLSVQENSQVNYVLMQQRLERAIGVIYRPDTEMQSHYFYASLPRQFDEYIWFDETSAVNPLGRRKGAVTQEAETFPFGI
jgi:erythromycin esterase-like protein